MKSLAALLVFLACIGCNISFIGGGTSDRAPMQDCGQAFSDVCAESCPDGTRALRRVCSCE